ncbi:MAG: peptidylprolyl isomerase [Bacteroidota bacterium]
MAIIGTIRKRGGLLITIVIGIAIMAFVLGDLLGPGGSLLSGGQYEIGEIAGETIPALSYNQRVQEAIDNYKEQAKLTNLDQATIDMLREQTWSQLLNELIMSIEYDELGIAVHADEMFDLITGSNPHPSIIQAFSNPETGEFNPVNVRNFLKNMDNDQTGATRAKWIIFEKAIKKEQMAAKYNNLIKKGLFVTTSQAKKDHSDNNRIARFRYVVQKYLSIPDSVVNVTEKDIKKYYNEHEKNYEQQASRAIEYVTFDVLPTRDDTLDLFDWITKIKEKFKEIENVEDAGLFVNMNADTRFNDSYFTQGILSDQIDSIMFSAYPDSIAEGSGTIVGPYLEEGAYKIAKLIDVQYRPDSVKARHILIKHSGRRDTTHLAKADSLKKLIQGGRAFAELAKSVSEDPGSAANDGDVGWFTEGTMVKPFNDSCFAGEKGELLVVETQFGAHLIEILDLGERVKKVRVAIIDRQIEPSAKTFAAIYAKANRFAGKNTDKASFDKAVIKMGLTTRIADELTENERTIIGLESPRELIRWAFRVKKGTVSGPFEFGNKFVVAILAEVKEKGFAPLEQIRTEIEVGAIKEKKAKMIINKIIANDDKNIDDLAHNLSANDESLNLTVEKIDNLSFSSFSIPGLGKEPELIGSIFGLKPLEISYPVKGNLGVYVVVLDSISAPPPIDNYSPNQSRQTRNMQMRVDYEVFEALKDKANIVDERYKFY